MVNFDIFVQEKYYLNGWGNSVKYRLVKWQFYRIKISPKDLDIYQKTTSKTNRNKIFFFGETSIWCNRIRQNGVSRFVCSFFTSSLTILSKYKLIFLIATSDEGRLPSHQPPHFHLLKTFNFYERPLFLLYFTWLNCKAWKQLGNCQGSLRRKTF